ncbi:hypothetical protein QR680_013256 [Steinernema hermaphroditum]|uniref:CUB domain-containing protein n=1 Tax=Steinernema hermaphroditum TaxID=289476 RepID=A0AA39I6G3_9BILA|nr:hypothetical protein QR680_013256 [Steinernema hermaphroditum]
MEGSLLLLPLLLAFAAAVSPRVIRKSPPLEANFVGCPENNDFYYGGVVTSPLYPKNYPDNEKCYYYIYAKQGSVARFDFTQFDLETCCDFVTIFDGRSEEAPILAQFGGPNKTASRPSGPVFSSTRLSFSSVYTASPCNRDVVLIVNGLSSVGSQQNFLKQLDFISNSLVASWTVGSKKVRVVVSLQVSRDYAVVFDANSLPDTNKLRSTVLGLAGYVPDVSKNNSTDFESLFHYAESEAGFQANRLGERSGVGRVVIVFVAQNPTNSQDFNAATEFAHNMRTVDDTKVITVAMGAGVDVQKVGTLSYGEGFYFGADYDQLDTLAEGISAAICRPEASQCGS